MARLARVVLPGIPHHVTQRGNRRQPTFFDDDDYRAYIALLAEACKRVATEVWAWCLMPNHVHLIVTPSTADGLRASIAETHRRYTRRINLREGWQGHLWQERFHSFPLDESHLLAAVRYVELNPVKAGLVKRPQDWRWSSARTHLSNTPDGLTHLEPLREMIPDWAAFLAADEESEKVQAILRHSSTGRPLGSDAFLKRAERVVGRPLRRKKPGPKPKRGEAESKTARKRRK